MLTNVKYRVYLNLRHGTGKRKDNTMGF